ncbi:MAG: hypothetical protein IJU35_01125 [Paludibacteraceae bacterium]|nr:hypothetical protein [Paludibacteraceae bacterium]
MKDYLFILLMLLGSMAIHAQRTVNACGEIDYVMPETQTLVEAKRNAIIQARLKAIANEFGTVVSQTNTTAMHNRDGKTNSSFNSYSENEVRGIWISDTNEPELTIKYRNEMTVIHVEVCGNIREQKRETVEVQIKPLNKGIESTLFKNNDRFSISFKSAANGYVAIFIRDDDNEIVNVMMPYEDSDGNAREVKSNKEYLFLCTKDPAYPYDEETILTTSKTIENNTLIIVFSQKKFHISLSNKGEFVPEVENSKFQKWLHGLRVYDTTAQVEETVLTIKK